MRTFGVLSYSESDNLGDEIQSIVAAQFLPHVATTVDRDHMHLDAPSRPIDLIFNGWFLAGHEWPPPDSVHPLLVSFYAPPECPQVYDRCHRDWFRRHEPIGCRSTAFLQTLAAMGVETYFSGCLTLCLPPAEVERTPEVCIVDCDPVLLHRLVPPAILKRATFLSHVERTDARTLRRRAWKRALRELRPHAPRLAWSIAAAYRRRRNADRLARAQALLDRYRRARLVITGRIHCFLPCLAMGTPVLLLQSAADAHRFAGLAELGRAYGERDQRIDIDWDHPDPNPGHHVPVAAALASTCQRWAAGGQ